MSNDVAPFLKVGSVAPVLVARDVDVALERFRKLGFSVRAYGEKPSIYGFVCYGPGDLHVARFAELDPLANTSACYLYVDDADAVFAAWSSAGVEGRFHPPSDTEYGLREMAYVDPDGNLFRVGSRLG
jgi:catechol 2,3-dioxygenase-like lactoylglutathione lyase family enzyme